MTARPEYGRWERALEWALLLDLVLHGGAVVWMAALGWSPWQMCAVGDLLLGIAMVGARWVPRVAWLALASTVAAVVCAQASQVGWAALLQALAGLGWTWCFATAGVWSRALTLLSVPLWSAMLASGASVLLQHPMGSAFVAAANWIGLVLHPLWFALVAEAVYFRARPHERHGRLARWRHPSRNPLARVADAVANSRLLGAVLEPLPELEMRSDITDVVYVNYLVRADEVEALVPEGLELERLGPQRAHALFTFLTFRHGNFGFAMLGPLRRFLPSPVQTNWRIHVRDPRTGHAGIYFLTNAIASTSMALGARLTTEGMPMHVLARGEIARDNDEIVITVDAGAGSAPDATMRLRPAKQAPALEGAWAECWKDYRAFLEYCVPQNRAMSSQPLRRRISRQEISLGVPFEACVPLEGTIASRAASALAGDAVPLAFHVEGVRFSFSLEAHDAW